MKLIELIRKEAAKDIEYRNEQIANTQKTIALFEALGEEIQSLEVTGAGDVTGLTVSFFHHGDGVPFVAALAEAIGVTFKRGFNPYSKLVTHTAMLDNGHLIYVNSSPSETCRIVEKRQTVEQVTYEIDCSEAEQAEVTA